MSLAWPEAILARAPVGPSEGSPRTARSWFIRHSVAASTTAALRPLGTTLAPGQALVDALARGFAARLEAGEASASRTTSSAAMDGAPVRFLAVVAPRRKCKNLCRTFRSQR